MSIQKSACKGCIQSQGVAYLQEKLIGDASIIHFAGEAKLICSVEVLVRGGQGLMDGQAGGCCQALQLTSCSLSTAQYCSTYNGHHRVLLAKAIVGMLSSSLRCHSTERCSNLISTYENSHNCKAYLRFATVNSAFLGCFPCFCCPEATEL